MGFSGAQRQHSLVFGGKVLVREPGRSLSPEKSLSANPKGTQTQARSKRNGMERDPARMDGRCPLRNVSDPDVPEAERLALVAVRLKFDWGAVIFLVEGLTYVERLPFQLEMILD
jgi:hypothetical protein